MQTVRSGGDVLFQRGDDLSILGLQPGVIE